MAANGSSDDQTRSFTILAAGTIISHYKIISKIGAGGMGEVYLAEDNELNRKVALKFLPQHLCQDENCRARFKREAQAAAALKHANIITIHEVSESQGRPFIVMEYIEGKSLRDIIKEGKLTINKAINLTMQICAGLNDAHETGIVHRDIKPSNILLDKNNQPIILDFGLATIKGAAKITKTGSTLGTMGYLSPEQARGEKADKRSDLFSVGVILYEMITGRQPFHHEYEAATLNAILHDAPEPLSRYKSGVAVELQQIVDKALEKNPETRYQHADDLLADLKRLQITTIPRRRSPTGYWIAVATIVIVIIGYFLINQFLYQSKADKQGWANSIAVLIFRDQSPNRDQDYFCEGMTDAIIGRLSNIKNLRVISLTSVLKIKDNDYDLKKVGKMLGVETILEGSILKERDRIRVRVQLIDVEEDTHLWSDQFDQKLESIFDVQDNISKAIVEVMKIELMGGEESSLIKRNTDNLEAYNEYTQGRYFWRKRTADGIQKSIEHFERAIELDSTYALAYSGLADAWNILPGYSNVLYPEVEQMANEAAKTAVRLDDNLAEAHASLAMTYWYSLRDIENAEIEFKRAIELNPCYSWAHLWYGNMLYVWWRDKEGKKRELEKALECDPLSIVALNNLAAMNSEDSNFVEAESLYKKLLEIEPANGTFRANFGIHFLRAGKIDEAVEQFEKAVELEPTYWDRYHGYAQELFDFGYEGRAEKVWQRVIAAYPEQPENYSNYGWYIKDNLKNYNDAIEQFNKAISLRKDFGIAYWGMADAYDKLKNYDEAISTAKQAITAKDYQPYYHKTLGEIYFHAGKLDSALLSYMTYLSRIPGDNQSINETGQIAILARHYDLADSLFGVMENHIVPRERAWGRYYKAKVLNHQGKFDQALKVLKVGIEIDRKETEEIGDEWPLEYKYYHRGLIFLLLENPDSAIVQFRQARQVMQNIDSTHYWTIVLEGRIAQSYAYKKDTAMANKIIHNCLSQIDSANTNKIRILNFQIAFVQSIIGNFDSAATIREQVIKSGEKYFDSFQECGRCYLGAGRIVEAIEMSEKAMEIFDNGRTTWPERDVLLHYELGQAYEAAGRIDEAVEQYEIFLDIWKNADDGLKSVEDAKERLAKLKEHI
jgi:serine/threonine protein kinase/tetratricopeptide (TPR) repeat protein